MDDVKVAMENANEAWRWNTVRTKEPGTVKWIEAQVQPGDVFYDIGANVGVYTVMAAQLVGPEGHVYAFEPHVANARSLLHNLSLNEWGKRVQVVTSALHDSTGYFPFNYRKMKAGTSGHQLGHTQGELGDTFEPVAVEIKHSTTVDDLLDKVVIRPPNVVKMDVDGNELRILHGMVNLLTHRPPRTLQVELHPQDEVQVIQCLQKHGFTLVERHYTEFGEQAKAAGIPAEKIAHNGVFIKV